MKKINYFLPFLFILVSCNLNISSSDSSSNSSSESSISSFVEFDPNENLDTAHAVFDDFDNGIQSSLWSIGNQKWGIGNGGVVYQNVNYTDDGTVVLQANGDYYNGPIKGIGNNNGKRTGAVLISRKAYGPGRFEVMMKAMPRFGATTAIWTFYNDGTINDEIDIELNVNNDFHSVMTTNWVTEQDKISKSTDTPFVQNDNEYHLYRFDWHTNPQRIDYYVDDILLFTSTAYIPQNAAQFWIGHWFPDAWAGTPDFETDYAFVDYFRYTPYLNNDYIATPDGFASPSQYYPKESIEMPHANLISNGGFEGDENAWKKPLVSNVSIENNQGNKGSKGIKIPFNDIANQIITGLDDSFELTLKGKAKLNNAKAEILIECYPDQTSLLDSYTLDFQSSDANYEAGQYYQKEYSFGLPTGTKRIDLSLMCLEGSEVYFDELFLNLVSKIPEEEIPKGEVFFADFNNGISVNDFEIANQVWGENNNGVKYQNVGYTSDGLVYLKACGNEYAITEYRRSGAVLITNKAFGPGSFEVKMKALPVFGATSTIWTYYHNGSINAEIDIELNVNNNWNRAWFTSWLTEENYHSEKMTVDIAHNDGNFHFYRFDWYTAPTPKIEYYIDDVLYYTEYNKVPNYAARFWVGTWFPNGWAGEANFTYDYMIVDYIKHTSFLDNDYISTPNGSGSPSAYYPSGPSEYD
ncbi:MAG: glycoside hydrolase family 16 protein [Bacillales bacterium]|jgi:hypothetical protein|nr:glycoside hydrolase family 16 protein [Bacillales bacterium]